MIGRGSCAGIAILLLVSCKPSPETVAKRNREAAEKSLARLEEIVKKAAALEPLKEDTLRSSAPDIRFRDAMTEGEGTAAILFESAYRERRKNDSSWPDFRLEDRWWGVPEGALRIPGVDWKRISGRSLEKAFEQLRGTRYVLVILERSCTKPEPWGDGVAGSRLFTKGLFTGEGHLFDLETSNHFGGFSFTATNGENLFNLTESDFGKFLWNDLMRQIPRAALAKLREKLPQAQVP